MDGFIQQARTTFGMFCTKFPFEPQCGGAGPSVARIPDVMGWHDAREIPNYWRYAQQFVLQDHMFESAFSWSLPSHLFTVSGWSASCADPDEPESCRSDLYANGEAATKSRLHTRQDIFGWTDLTYRLHKAGVS
jgi:phospholipase C